MKFIEKKEKVEYLLYLIKQGRLNSTEKIAEKYGISRRTVERMISMLKEEGYNIKFSRISGKYYIKD